MDDGKAKILVLKDMRNTLMKQDAKKFKKKEEKAPEEPASPIMLRLLQIKGK